MEISSKDNFKKDNKQTQLFVSNLYLLLNKNIPNDIMCINLEEIIIILKEELELLVSDNDNNYLITEQFINVLKNEKLKDTTILYYITRMFDIIFDKKYYSIICPIELVYIFLNNVLKTIYMNNKYSILHSITILKVHSYIQYLSESLIYNEILDKSILNEFIDSFPVSHFFTYEEFVNEIETHEYDKYLGDCFFETKGVELIKILENKTKNLICVHEQFQILILLSKTIFPKIYAKSKILSNLEVFYKLGFYLIDYIYYPYFILYNDNQNKSNINLIIDNDNIITDISLIDKSRYSKYIIEDKFELLNLYYKEIINILLEYINNSIKYESDFRIQFLIYNIIKRIYLIFPNYKSIILNIFPDNLLNLSNQQDESIWKITKECREFSYYLLTNEKEIKIKSISVQSENINFVLYNYINLSNFKLRSGKFTRLYVECGESRTIPLYLMNKNNHQIRCLPMSQDHEM